MFAGASFSSNKDNISMQTSKGDSVAAYFMPVLTNRLAQSKLVFTKSFAGLTKLHIGVEYQNIKDGIVAQDSIAQRYLHENYLASDKKELISIDQVKNARNIHTWNELVSYWTTLLEKTAEDFCKGVAKVDPIDRQVCQKCGLQSVCRLKE